MTKRLVVLAMLIGFTAGMAEARPLGAGSRDHTPRVHDRTPTVKTRAPRRA